MAAASMHRNQLIRYPHMRRPFKAPNQLVFANSMAGFSSFRFFPLLPLELRLQIYDHAMLNSPRHIYHRTSKYYHAEKYNDNWDISTNDYFDDNRPFIFNPVPPLMHVNHEARDYSRKHYTLWSAESESSDDTRLFCPKNFYFNPEVDVYVITRAVLDKLYEMQTNVPVDDLLTASDKFSCLPPCSLKSEIHHLALPTAYGEFGWCVEFINLMATFKKLETLTILDDVQDCEVWNGLDWERDLWQSLGYEDVELKRCLKRRFGRDIKVRLMVREARK